MADLISAAFKVSSLHFFNFIEINWCFIDHDWCSLTRFYTLTIRNRPRSGSFTVHIRFIIEIEKTCLICGWYIWGSYQRICIACKWRVYQRYWSERICCENSWFQIQSQRLKISWFKVTQGWTEGHFKFDWRCDCLEVKVWPRKTYLGSHSR